MARLNIFGVIKSPRISSKAIVLNSKQQPCLVIDVHVDANKPMIKQAVQTLFGVEVEKVNTLIGKGKKRTLRGRYVSFDKDYKKAFVTLKKGQKISDLDMSSGVVNTDVVASSDSGSDVKEGES